MWIYYEISSYEAGTRNDRKKEKRLFAYSNFAHFQPAVQIFRSTDIFSECCRIYVLWVVDESKLI